MSPELHKLSVVSVGASQANLLLELLGQEHGCFCRYWFFGGDKNAWFEQCSARAEDNAALLRAECTELSPGLIALQNGVAVAWMRLAPLGAMSKLTNHGTYKRLALAGDDTLAVACIYVRENARNTGILHALVKAIPSFAKAASARAVLAFPAVPPSAEGTRLHDAALMMGAHSTYLSHGFERISGDDAYPVLRLDLHA